MANHRLRVHQYQRDQSDLHRRCSAPLRSSFPRIHTDPLSGLSGVRRSEAYAARLLTQPRPVKVQSTSNWFGWPLAVRFPITIASATELSDSILAPP
jgi:hypothetical protein